MRHEEEMLLELTKHSTWVKISLEIENSNGWAEAGQEERNTNKLEEQIETIQTEKHMKIKTVTIP